MPLRANREVDHYVDQNLRAYAVAGGAHIYKGAFVGLVPGGYAQPLAKGNLFVGIAYEESDNSQGSGGDVSVRVFTMGDFGIYLDELDACRHPAMIGCKVYALDDEKVTLDQGRGSTEIGRVQDWISRGEVVVRLTGFIKRD